MKQTCKHCKAVLIVAINQNGKKKFLDEKTKVYHKEDIDSKPMKVRRLRTALAEHHCGVGVNE